MFYNKWLYKATLKMEGASVFRMYNLSSILEKIEEDTHGRLMYLAKAKNNKNSIARLVNFLTSLDKEFYFKRIERNTITLYVNNKELFDNIVKEFNDIVSLLVYPIKQLEEGLEDSQTILVKKLPHNRYRYKAFLTPHRVSSIEEKAKYIAWIQNNPNILISETVSQWFIVTHWNWDRRYVFVEDHATLVLLKLRNPEALGRVYNYKIIDK